MNIIINRNNSNITLVNQIYKEIKSKIHNGIIKPNQKILSSRQLAKDLQVSRNVVVEAYEQLFAEGYIKTIKGSGTYVNDGLFLKNYKNQHTIKRENIKGLKVEPKNNLIDFRTGVPNLSTFPKELWGNLYKKICTDLNPIQLDYHEPRGCYDLRYELAIYLNRVRGILCQPSQVIITTGAAQSFSMIVELFNSQNEKIIVEDPLSYGVLECIEKTDLNIYPIPVDSNGMRTDLLPKNLYPKLIFTTPSHQFPTGTVLPIKRRVDLIEYARTNSSYIVEDDYDSEFRFEGIPIKSMQCLDTEKVIYVGTFSKILCPALRLAYIVVPEKLIEDMCYVKSIYDIHSPVLEQLTLSMFINKNYLDKHIRKLKNLYKKKVNLISKEINKYFHNDEIIITGNSTGIHLVLEFKNFSFTKEVLDKLEKKGLKVQSMEKHTIIKGQHMNKLLMGYGNLTDNEIINGIQILSMPVYKIS